MSVASGTSGRSRTERNELVDAGPRESMRRLPDLAQLPLTLLTGKPYTGQRSPRPGPTLHLLMAVLSTVVGVTGSTAAVFAGGWFLAALPITWAITLHGMRNLRMMIYHQCAHRNMWARRGPDALLGKLLAALLLVQNFGRYSKEHVGDHHALHHMTLKDPTVQAFLISLEVHPGMPRRRMWLRLSGKLLSPRFHLGFAIGRLRSFLHGSSWTERSAGLLVHGGIAAATISVAGWTAWPLVWLVPLFPLFQVSNTLRLCVKHTFPGPADETRHGKAYFASLTNAIFLGEAVPERAGGALRAAARWSRWGTRMACVHFPARYLVLTGDTVCHDFHHRYPSTRNWSDYIFARQRDLEDGHPGWPAYDQVWGLVPAINKVFDSLSAADPDEFDVHKIGAVSGRELFAAFDD